MQTTRKDLIRNAQAYNKFLTDEICENLSDNELFARCHPIFRDETRYELIKSETIY